ncbi:MAG: invertase, partial [Verrucomicrobiales bacterium]|nr:invertase [Verrucomicrobiales bacterium]
MKKSAAIYARVSSERQKEEGTIASQTALLLEYAQAHDWTVPAEWIFEDEGYSGAMLARPGLERLRDLVAEGQIQAILIYGPDRLSRKYAYQVLLMEEFSRQGVETIFLKSASAQTPEDRLLLQFQGMIAEYERAQIAERTRRGKRHRAKAGCVNVLSGAPYGYRYVRKSELSQACYEVVEAQAEVVGKIFEWYTRQLWSIGAIARQLNQEQIKTRSGRGRWERSTVWGMLRNPAYQGTACFGKTEVCARQRITRPLRQKGGYSRRSSASKEKDRSQWIEVAVPALVSADTFALAQERLAQNKQISLRNTREPTLLQGLLVCQRCGYALYRTSTRTTRRQIKYYRCLGSDKYRHLRGPVCSCRPLRQDYLDALVWEEILRLLRTPELIREELERRRTESLNSSPVQQRQEQVKRELTRLSQQMDKLLDAYQEGLLPLAELRKRSPDLQKRIEALNQEQKNLHLRAVEDQRWNQLSNSMECFLKRLNENIGKMTVAEKQKMLRMLIKQVTVGEELITIHHSIPLTASGGSPEPSSYPLCTRSGFAALSQSLPALVRPEIPSSGRSGPLGQSATGPLCGRFRDSGSASGRTSLPMDRRSTGRLVGIGHQSRKD